MDPEPFAIRLFLASNFARALAASRRSRTHIADIAGCSRDIVFDLLGARVAVRLDILDRLAIAVRWPTWALLSDMRESPPPADFSHTVASCVVLARCTRALLIERGWSVRSLARRGGPSKTQLYAILDGTHGTTIDGLARVARAFGLDPSFLITPTDEQNGVVRDRRLPPRSQLPSSAHSPGLASKAVRSARQGGLP
jgi:lambda repressor-like predicted transcriptional regulator